MRAVVIRRRLGFVHDAFVMIVHRDGQGFLGFILPDAVEIQLSFDFGGL